MGDPQYVPSPMEAAVKLRSDKKWKSRFCRLTKSGGSVRLSVFKSPKSGKQETYKDLSGFYGTETGSLFNVELCVSPEESILNESCKTEVERGVRLHIQDGRFCVAGECPPRILDQWKMAQLRKFGPILNKFCFEVGSRGGKAPGLYIFLTSQSDQLQLAFTMASRAKLHEYLTNRARPVSDDRTSSGGEGAEGSKPSSFYHKRSNDFPGRGMKRSSDSEGVSSERVASSEWDFVLKGRGERRPLLSSITSNYYSQSERRSENYDAYTNDVFEPESPRPEEGDYEPQPFMLPQHRDTRTGLEGEGEGPFGLHRAYLPHTLIINPRSPPDTSLPFRESNYLNLPEALRDSAISSDSAEKKKPVPGRRRMPPAPLPLPVQAEAGKGKDYINQNFIDSLQFYCNADVLILPSPVSGSHGHSRNPIRDLLAMDMSQENYVPYYPASPLKKGCQGFSEEEAPPDPTNSAGEEDKPVRKTPSPEITGFVHQTLPPWKPIPRPSSRSPELVDLDWSPGSKNYADVSANSCLPPHRSYSVCSPNPSSREEKTWSHRGQSLPGKNRPYPKTSETVGQALARSSSTISDYPMVRQRSLSQAGSGGRGGILRQSSRRARIFLGGLLGKKQWNKRAGSEPPFPLSEEPPGLDLDEPEYLAAQDGGSFAVAKSERRSPVDGFISPDILPPRRKFGFLRGASIESSGSSDNGISRNSLDLEGFLDNLSIPSSENNSILPPSRPPNASFTSTPKGQDLAPELPPNSDHYYSRIRRQPDDPVGALGQKHSVTPPGLIKLDASRRKQRARADLSRPVTGSYSVYDGDKAEDKGKIQANDNVTFGIVGRKVPTTQKLDRRLGRAVEGSPRKHKPGNLNLEQQRKTSGVGMGAGMPDQSPGPPTVSPPTYRAPLTVGEPSPGPGTGPSSTRSSPLASSSANSPGFLGLERKGTGPKVFRFPETLLEETTKQLNYCDLVIGGEAEVSDAPRRAPKSAFPAFSLQKGTNYARIDPLATIAAKDASNQRTADLRRRSSSVQTLNTTERKPSKARRFFSKKHRPLSRRTSLSSLTDVQ